MLAKVSPRGGGKHDRVRDCGAVCGASQGLCSSFQNPLLCVQTVVVIMWFSWLGPWESMTGSTDKTNDHQLPCRRPALSVTLLTTVTTAAGLTGPRRKRWSPESATVGASVPVSSGETGPRWFREAGEHGGSLGRLMAPCLPPAPERRGLRSVDHRLRLFLDVEVFADTQEEFQCCLKVCASPALPCVPPLASDGGLLCPPQPTVSAQGL